MALTIYGSPRSRTMRTLWMAAELGLDYVHVPYAYDDARLKQPEFLALNPAGTIPTIVDDGFALTKSLAIVTSALTALDRAIATRAWLVGDIFTVADLNVACVLSPSRAAHLDLRPHAHVGRWLRACYARPAAVETRKRYAATA